MGGIGKDFETRRWQRGLQPVRRSNRHQRIVLTVNQQGRRPDGRNGGPQIKIAQVAQALQQAVPIRQRRGKQPLPEQTANALGLGIALIQQGNKALSVASG